MYKQQIGNWAYGHTKQVWLNKKNYSRQVKREAPLKEVRFDALRIITDAEWHLAQELLADLSPNGGRHPKDGDRRSRPRILNGLLVCATHGRQLHVAGAHGRYMVCPACRDMAEPFLYSHLPRRLTLQLICSELAELITADSDLVDAIVAHARDRLVHADRPDEAELAEIDRRIGRLTTQIDFILHAPGDSELDLEENRSRLAALRKERTGLQHQRNRLEEQLQAPASVPQESEIRSAVGRIRCILLEAAKSDDPSALAELRGVIELMTGGRIMISQMGERKRKQGWLRATFTATTVAPVLASLGVPGRIADPVDVEIDLRSESLTDIQSETAKRLYDQDLLNTEIADRMGVSKSRVTFLIKHWGRRHDVVLPDGRRRRSTLPQKQTERPPYKELGESAFKLAMADVSDREIGRRLGVTDTTARKAIEEHCRMHGLPVPTAAGSREAKLQEASRLLEQGLLLKDIARGIGYSPRGLKLALKKYLADRGRKLPDGRSRRGNARAGERAQNPDVLDIGPARDEPGEAVA